MRYLYKYDQGLIDTYRFHVLGDLDDIDLCMLDFYDDALSVFAGAWRPLYAEIENLLILYKILELSNGRPGMLISLKGPDCPKSIWGVRFKTFPKDPSKISWSMCSYYKSIYDDLFFCSDFSAIDMGTYHVYAQKGRDRSIIRYSDMLRSGLFYDMGTLDLNSGFRLSFQALKVLQRPFENIGSIIKGFQEIIDLKFAESFTDAQQQSWDDFIGHLRQVIFLYESLSCCPYQHVSYEMVIHDVYELCHDITIVHIPDEAKRKFVCDQFAVIMQKIWYAFL